MSLPKDQEQIYKALVQEWTREFMKRNCAPLLLLGAVNGTNKIGYAIAPGVETETALKLLRGAIELIQTGGGIITL